jgi:hypothetical protein
MNKLYILYNNIYNCKINVDAPTYEIQKQKQV